MSINIRSVSLVELELQLPTLVEQLRETVNGGAPMGFLAPLTQDDGRNYWLGLRAELQTGSRLLLAANDGDRVVGSGQLNFPPWPTRGTESSCRSCSSRPGCEDKASADR